MTKVIVRINGVFAPSTCQRCGRPDEPGAFYYKADEFDFLCVQCATELAPNTVKIAAMLGDKFDEPVHTVSGFGRWLDNYLAKANLETLALEDVETLANTQLRNAQKAQTLNHYAEVTEPRHYRQIDGWVNAPTDFMVNPDGERYSLTGAESYELWRTDSAVRIHIADDVHPLDAIAILSRAVDWLTTIAVDMATNGNKPLPGDWTFPDKPAPRIFPQNTPDDFSPPGQASDVDHFMTLGEWPTSSDKLPIASKGLHPITSEGIQALIVYDPYMTSREEIERYITELRSVGVHDLADLQKARLDAYIAGQKELNANRVDDIPF